MCIRDRLHSLLWIELSHGLQKSLVSDSDELGEVEAMTLILLDVRDDEPEVRGDQSLCSLFISCLCATRQPTLFFCVSYQREFLDVLEVLIECGGRGRTEKAFRPALGRSLHSRPGWVVSASAYGLASPVLGAQ